MALPFFYIPQLQPGVLVLDEATSKHITGVLRMQVGEDVLLTNGKGAKALARITDDHRKRCAVDVQKLEVEPPQQPAVTIAISLVKNTARFEWFLEKATEIGVTRIIPLLCERTEKEKFREERLQAILVSAMLQSQQVWLPLLEPPTAYEQVIKKADAANKFIAHCLPEERQLLTHDAGRLKKESILLIGPEGDFTPAEIELALQQNFAAVTLGNTRLRTETAGMVAATLLRQLAL